MRRILGTILAMAWAVGRLPAQQADPGRRAQDGAGFPALAVVQRRELNPSHVYTAHVEGFGAGGGLWTWTPGAAEPLRKIVDSPQGQILDADVSYDGAEILFSWRRTKEEGYHLWRVKADGTELRQITRGDWHDYNACWLPDGGIGFLSTRDARFAYCWVSPVGVLHRMGAEGHDVRRLSANIVNDFTPSVTSDGRILYSRWEYVDKPAIPIQSLWSIRPDGTGLAGVFGNRVLSPATFMEARDVPGTGKILCVLTSHNGPARGAIGLIDPAMGPNAQEGIRNLTPEVPIGRVDKGDGNNVRGPYESPYPLDAARYLVSRRGTLLLRDVDGPAEAVLLEPRDGLGWYSAQPLRARPRPPVPVSRRDPAETGDWAGVFVQDVYQGLEPHVARGEVKRIAVVEELKKAVRTDVSRRAFGFQFPVISCGATYAAKKVWGFADVREDGSAAFRVPAGVPVYFLALDAEGRAVQRMRTFTHFMPGEMQGCVGCHEPRRSAGARQAPPLLPAGRPVPLSEPEWGVRGFDYSALVQPVLDRHCIACHDGPGAPGGVDLSGDKTDFFNVSYETLARGRRRRGEAEWDSPYVSWIPTYNGMERNILEITPKAWGSPRSPLADLLVAGHPDAQGRRRIDLPEADRRRILTWIDLNVPYYGTSETAYPDHPGCRRIYPADLDRALAEVAARRCTGCHAGGKIPRPSWTRLQRPERNRFLAAPLAKAAGGLELCGPPVYASADDPDFRAILRTFDPVERMLKERPRMDMPGAKPAPVDRSCLGSLR